MGEATRMTEFLKTACPHDCPSACALEVERLAPDRIGRVRGQAGFDYTEMGRKFWAQLQAAGA